MGSSPFQFSHCSILIVSIVNESYVYVLWMIKNNICKLIVRWCCIFMVVYMVYWKYLLFDWFGISKEGARKSFYLFKLQGTVILEGVKGIKWLKWKPNSGMYALFCSPEPPFFLLFSIVYTELEKSIYSFGVWGV